MLHQRLAEALRDAAVDLAAHDHRVEHAAEIVDHEIAVDHDFAGLRIDLQLAHVRAVRMVRRIGAVGAARLQADAELLGQRAHRRVEGLRHAR